MKTPCLHLALKVKHKEQQGRKGTSGFWLWIIFLLYPLIQVLHFSEFILLARLHCYFIGIKYFVSGMMQGLSSAQSVLPGRARPWLGVHWEVVAAQACAVSAVWCKCPWPSSQLCWGKVPLSLPVPHCCTEPGTSGMMANDALFMFPLWVGQIPFVFQQGKRTSCFIAQLFCCGFKGQDMKILPQLLLSTSYMLILR